jgi:hypothetical protein
MRDQFSSILRLLPNLIILQSEFEDSAADIGREKLSEDLGMDFTEDIRLMTHPEFNSFLLELFLQDKDREKDKSVSRPPSRAIIKSAVDFLIRLKLKTVVGRAQEFFSQLQYIFRKARRTNASIPLWKLEFAYELEKKIMLCIHQSSFLLCTVPEV